MNTQHPHYDPLLKLPEIADRLGISLRSLVPGRKMRSLCEEYGLFQITAGWRMRESDLDTLIKGLACGVIKATRAKPVRRNTGAAGTRPEPGDSQCASQPGEGSEGEPSGPELANSKNCEL